jgi:hypothetical protein
MPIPGRHPRATERDLARLADGTLEPGRRQVVEKIVAASGELQDRLREQRRAVEAVRGVSGEPASLALRIRRRALEPPARPRPRLLGLGLAGVVGALTWTLATLGGGQAVPTVADAATIAARPATAMVAEPVDDTATLPRVSAAGLPFPYWEDAFGWRATGIRRDHVDGRLLTTVFYRSYGRRIAYTIVPGTSLPGGPGAQTIERSGVVVHAFADGPWRIVTWLRRGHTCVLSGTGVPLEALLKLVASQSDGAVRS